MLLQRAHARLTELFGPPSAFAGATVWEVPTDPGQRCRVFLSDASSDLYTAWIDCGGDHPADRGLLESQADVETLAAQALAAGASNDQPLGACMTFEKSSSRW